ncbi:MAG: hypothetical protein N3A69_09190 [Leptospiraceae bacterium]|nr:hypothetical protein [Leptospiraceae bacterium]
MKFKTVVCEITEIKNCYKDGLKALKSYQNKIILTNSNACDGSVDLDSCLEKNYPNENRWDYIFAYEEKVYCIEVHPARTGEVSKVLTKLKWLKSWLNKEENRKLKNELAKNPYHWIATEKIQILPRSPQYKRAAEAGLLPKKDLKL